jgi:hypothetical protein
MSSKIDGVPRELLERCIRANDEAQPSQLYADLVALLEAPVVERQPVDAILLENCEDVTVQDYGRGYFATDDCVAQLYTAPPELSELQAELAETNVRLASSVEQVEELQSEIDRLKGGQGEPIYQFGVNVSSTSWTDVSKEVFEEYARRGGWSTRIVHTSQPAPVIGIDQGEPGGDMTATAVFKRDANGLTLQSLEHRERVSRVIPADTDLAALVYGDDHQWSAEDMAAIRKFVPSATFNKIEPACSFCFQRGCNGECHGDDMMGGD